ncbi:hypothetical protein D3C83_260300 [compost metagenome]
MPSNQNWMKSHSDSIQPFQPGSFGPSPLQLLLPLLFISCRIAVWKGTKIDSVPTKLPPLPLIRR